MDGFRANDYPVRDCQGDRQRQCRPVQDRWPRRHRAASVPAVSQSAVLPVDRLDVSWANAKGSERGNLTAGVEYVSVGVSRIHASLKPNAMDRRALLKTLAVLPIATVAGGLFAAPATRAKLLVVFLRGG